MPLANTSSMKEFLKFMQSVSTIIFPISGSSTIFKAFAMAIALARRGSWRFCNLPAANILGCPSQSLAIASQPPFVDCAQKEPSTFILKKTSSGGLYIGQEGFVLCLTSSFKHFLKFATRFLIKKTTYLVSIFLLGQVLMNNYSVESVSLQAQSYAKVDAHSCTWENGVVRKMDLMGH